MNDTQPTRIERDLQGTSVAIGDYVIQPQARLTGWQWQEAAGRSAGALVQVAPTAVLVTHGDGAEQRLSITNPNFETLRKLAGIAFALAAVCLPILLIAQFWPRRRPLSGE